VARAERTYVDPSALLKLYVHEPESSAMSAWRSRKGALPITQHGQLELVNGICLAGFRSLLGPEALKDALASFAEDLQDGRYAPVDVLWRATLRRAEQLSRELTPKLGCRTLDVVHVASALELGMRAFVTFDHRQAQLAAAAGLRIVLGPTLPRS
jgi:predicted nucleic acid-binding protein